MIIKFDPHGFVVFFTIAMGMVYAATRKRGGWGFWNLAVVGIFVLPFLYYGFLVGRAVEVVAGGLIGLIYARGRMNIRSLNPFSGLMHYFQDFRANRAAKKAFKKAKREQAKQRRPGRKTNGGNANSTSGSNTNTDEKVRRRQEQAKAQRERANAQEDASKPEPEESKSNSGNSGYSSNQSYEKRPPQQPKRPVDIRTPYEILGVSRDATPAQVKKAYGMLRSRYHPDKYEHMSDTFKREAADEFKKVQKAWEALR